MTLVAQAHRDVGYKWSPLSQVGPDSDVAVLVKFSVSTALFG